jgi:nucleoside-diphosphate-sugar epimerase
LSSILLPERVILISTTGVYGDCKGAWVDERAVPKPEFDRALRRYDMEQYLINWCLENQVKFTILRVPGIYGPGKLPVQRIMQRKPVLNLDESPWSNRIHVDDLITVCLKSRIKDAENEIFNISDGHPSTMTEYFNTIAEFFGLEYPPQISMEDARKSLSKGMISYLQESRRISNQKMLKVLGVKLKYPLLEEGLISCKKII